MILMIDNYDSFTYNLVQYLREMAAEVRVFRNDAITVAEIEKLAPAAPRTPAFRATRFAPAPARSRCSASASATRPWASSLAEKSSTPKN